MSKEKTELGLKLDKSRDKCKLLKENLDKISVKKENLLKKDKTNKSLIVKLQADLQEQRKITRNKREENKKLKLDSQKV